MFLRNPTMRAKKRATVEKLRAMAMVICPQRGSAGRGSSDHSF